MMKINYRKLSSGNYLGRSGKYYIFIRKRKHHRYEGFDNFWVHYSVFITKEGEYIFSEGVFGTSLRTILKAKKWAKEKLRRIVTVQASDATEAKIVVRAMETKTSLVATKK